MKAFARPLKKAQAIKVRVFLFLFLFLFMSLVTTAYASNATYQYDDLDRLVVAVIDGSRVEYTYDAAGNLNRVFTPYAILSEVNGDGRILDDLGKLDCGNDCEGVYDIDASVTLNAVPDSGYVFMGWSGACGGLGACQLVVNEVLDVGALFEPVANEADLSVTNTDQQQSATPGAGTEYTIVVANSGPIGVEDALLNDVFPSVLDCNYSSVASGGASGNTVSGSGDLTESLILPAGSSVTYSVACAIDSGAIGLLSNTVSVSSSVYDPDLSNNSATDTSSLIPSADLSVLNTDSVLTATPGLQTVYSIVVSNSGPSDVPDAIVSDVFPSLLSCQFSSAANGGATGNNPSGSGDIGDTLFLPANSEVVYEAVCDIDSSAAGILENTVAVSSSVADPGIGNEVATDTTELIPQAWLSVSKTNCTEIIVTGETTTYTMVVTNNGPSEVLDAAFEDIFRSDLSCTFTSSASGGAAGNTVAGAGNIEDVLHLPSNSSVSYSADCVVSTQASGRLINTATITSTVAGPELASRTATDISLVEQPGALIFRDGFEPQICP